MAWHRVRVDCDVPLLQPYIERLSAASDGFDGHLRIAATSDGYTLSRDDGPPSAVMQPGTLYERLLSDICFTLVDTFTQGLAFHAGCVRRQDQCILIAGVSGAGKTTTTAWLLGRGYDYLTDELVRVPFASTQACGWGRPLHVKSGSLSLVQKQQRGVRQVPALHYPRGAFVMPENFAAGTVPVASPTHVLFVRYERATATRVTALRPAQSATRLVQHLVNARNLPGHGVRQLIAFSRRLQAYDVHYSHVEDLAAHLPL